MSDGSSDVCSSDLSGKLLRRRDSRFDAHRSNALGHRDAKFREQFFRLIFVDVHGVCRTFRLWKGGDDRRRISTKPRGLPPPETRGFIWTRRRKTSAQRNAQTTAELVATPNKIGRAHV